MQMQLVSTFGHRLKEYMKSHDDMTYEQLAAITGCPAQTLNRYVLQQRVPKITDFAAIAQKLDVNPLWLQGYDIQEKLAPISKDELSELKRTITEKIVNMDESQLTVLNQIADSVLRLGAK